MSETRDYEYDKSQYIVLKSSLRHGAKEDEDCYWLIHFEDAEVSNEVFTDKAAAIKAYNEALVSWNCTLFKQYKPTSQPPETI